MALHGRVLLLNQTFEPLGTWRGARAIIMMLKETVTVEEWDGDRVLHTTHDAYRVPSVVRRRTYINVRRRRAASGMKRLRIYMRDKFRCQYCGDNTPLNVVAACLACNNRKGNRTPEEARMPLLTTQSALRVKLERVVLCHYAEARPEWKKYIFMDAHDDRSLREKARTA